MMTDDLVRRLREPPFGTETSERNLMAAAADEIDRLRAELAVRAAPCHIDGCQYDETDRLRKWLQVIANHPVEGSGMWEVGAREMLRCARAALAGEEKK